MAPLLGSKLAGRIPEAALRKAFGWFVLAMGTFVLIQQAPEGARIPALIALLGVAGGDGHLLGVRAALPPPPRRDRRPRATAGA